MGGTVSKPDDDASLNNRASKRSIRRFVITEKAPTRAFSWLKAATSTFTFKTFQPGEGPSRGLLRDYEPSDGPF